MLWQAGYQKSGNTWLCAIITHMVTGEQETWREYTEAIPNWYDWLVEGKWPSHGWVRSHACLADIQNVKLPDGSSVKLRPRDSVDSAVYIVRHPYDICLSAYRYRTVVDDDVTLPLDRYIDEFIEHGGDPMFKEMNGGDWHTNVGSWIGRHDLRGMMVRYEDLMSDAADVARQIVEFFAFDPVMPPERAAELADASAMREKDDQGFIGDASSGGWRDVFTKEQEKKGMEKFGQALEALGYS